MATAGAKVRGLAFHRLTVLPERRGMGAELRVGESASYDLRVSNLMLLRMAVRALRRPRLMVPLVRAAWRFRSRGWYRRAPFLPLPPSDYLAWRLHTAYGGEDRAPAPGELERYLRWAAWMRRER